MRNKRKIWMILGAVTIVIMAVSYFLVSENLKTQGNNDYITVKHKKLTLGSMLTAELTEEGVKKYPAAEKYALYDESRKKEISLIYTKMGEESMVIPKVNPGESITVILYDKDEKVITKLKSRVIR